MRTLLESQKRASKIPKTRSPNEPRRQRRSEVRAASIKDAQKKKKVSL